MTSSPSTLKHSLGHSSATRSDHQMESFRFILWRESDQRAVVVAVVLAIVLGVVVGLLYFVFTTIRIAGPSMEPALRDQDRVLVTKGYEEPMRGDIVSATVPDEYGEPVRVVKRVAAVPGDTVEIYGDRAYVNGRRIPGGADGDGAPLSFPAFTVPEGYVYLLGDNRQVSYDSRVVGAVPITVVRGKVVAIILPLSRFAIVE